MRFLQRNDEMVPTAYAESSRSVSAKILNSTFSRPPPLRQSRTNVGHSSHRSTNKGLSERVLGSGSALVPINGDYTGQRRGVYAIVNGIRTPTLTFTSPNTTVTLSADYKNGRFLLAVSDKDT
jgi:hypothetical protein